MINNGKTGAALLVKAGLAGIALSLVSGSAMAQITRGSMAETGKVFCCNSRN